MWGWTRAGRAGRGWGKRRWGAHSKAHRSLQGRARPGLAADVVEGEEQVVVLSHAGRKTQLELLVELRRPGGAGLGVLLGAGFPLVCPTPSAGPRCPCCLPQVPLFALQEPAHPPTPLPAHLYPHPSPNPAHLLVMVDHRCEGFPGKFTAAGLAKDDLRGAKARGTGWGPAPPPPLPSTSPGSSH